MNVIEVIEKLNKEYAVVIAYAGFDSHDDKGHFLNEEPDVYKVLVKASTSMQAIQEAYETVQSIRAEIMTDFLSNHPLLEDKEMITVEEVEHIREETQKRGIFRSWLAIEPTSIQVHLLEDEERLLGVTMENIDAMRKDISDDVTDFLKGNDG
mgnify:CR=1 FL=1